MKHETKPGPFSWARKASNGFEVSTASTNAFNKQFSALNAKLESRGWRTIEMAYQLDADCKGYQPGGQDWRLGKGKPSLDPNMTPEDLWLSYLCLWWEWAFENMDKIEELCKRVVNSGYIITDCFAWTPVSQARALAVILNELYPDGAPHFKKP